MYKKIDDYPDHYILHHQNGHEVKIAKKALNPATLKKLQHFAGGGAVPQSEADKFNQGFAAQTIAPKPPPPKKEVKKLARGGEVEDPTKNLVPAEFDLGQNYSQAPQTVPEVASAGPGSIVTSLASNVGEGIKNLFTKSPMASGMENARANEAQASMQHAILNENQKPQLQKINLGVSDTAQSPNLLTLSNQAQTGLTEEAYQTGLKGIEAQQQAIQQEAKAKEAPLQQQVDNFQKLIQDTQEIDNKFQEQQQAYKDAIQNHEIDPRRLFKDMSIWDKMGQGIALMLGGMGGAVTGQGNVVLTQMNKMIDQDIRAQELELGKKENLLSQNLKEYGSMREARIAAALQYKTLLDARLDQAVNNAKTPQAQAAALNAKAMLQKEMLPLRSHLVQTATLAKYAGQQGSQVQPETLIRAFVPEKHQEKAYEELKAVQVIENTAKNALDSFDTLDNKIGAGIFSPNERSALIDPIVTKLSKETAGRFTEADAKYLKTLFPSPGEANKTRQTKRQKLTELLREKSVSPLLKSYFIPTPQIGAETPIPGGRGLGMRQANYKK